MRDRLRFHAARALGSLPAPLQVRLSGGAPVVVAGQTLHPEMQLLLAAAKFEEMPWAKNPSAARVRRAMARECRVSGGAPAQVGAVRDLEIQGAVGPLRARHYAPVNGQGAPLLVFYHGGGFVFGDVDTHDAPCRLLCRHAGVHVLSVDYRLAPEHPFPAAVDDARAAFLWAHGHARELGADATRIGVGGDSAGGNLSAVVAQIARDERGPSPSCQVLIYPTVDSTERRPSMRDFSEGFFLTRDAMDWFTAQYRKNVDPADPRLSPLVTRDLSGLAPALVVTAAFDPLRDEGEAYATALRKSGTPAVLRRFDGMIHGFINLVGVSQASRDAVIEIAGATRALFALSAAHGS